LLKKCKEKKVITDLINWCHMIFLERKGIHKYYIWGRKAYY